MHDELLSIVSGVTPILHWISFHHDKAGMNGRRVEKIIKLIDRSCEKIVFPK